MTETREHQIKQRKKPSHMARPGYFWRMCRLLVLMLSLAVPPQALAQSFAVGYAKYQRGDFKAAEAALSQALSAKPVANENAKIYKYLGISQYMQGNLPAAAASFAQALRLSPNSRIEAGEVLDEAVIAFFEKQRSTSSSSAKTADTKSSPAPGSTRNNGKTIASAPPKPKASAPQKSAAARDGSSAAPAKRTILKVQSNASDAQISIDGILAGRAGELINTDPGVVPVEVSAPGFVTKTIKVTVTKDRENTVTINLDKIPPPAPPKPKAPLMAVAKAPPKTTPRLNNTPAVRAKGTGVDPRSSARPADGRGEDDLFAPTPQDETYYNAKNPRAAGAGGAGAGSRNLAAEFEQDAAAAVAPAPVAQAYPPGTYPPGAYQAGSQPQPAAAGGAYVPPPQSAYPYAPPQAYYGGYAPAPVYTTPPIYQPPPAYPPPSDANGGPAAQGGVPPSSGYNDPAPLPDPAYAEAEGEAYGAPPSRRMTKKFIYILPLGIGQFVQKRHLIGSLFAAGEIGLIGLAYYNLTIAQDARKAYESDCVGKTNSDGTPVCNRDDEERYNQSIKEGNKFTIYYGVGAAITAFVGGVEALIHARDPVKDNKSSKKKTKGKRSKPRKYRGFTGLTPEDNSNAYSLWEEIRPHDRETFTWDLGIVGRFPKDRIIARPWSETDAFSGQAGEMTPSLLLDVTWTF